MIGATEDGACCGATVAAVTAAFSGFTEYETETLMHVAHIFIARGLGAFFFECTGLNPNWDVPPDCGKQDPYLRPRGGTKMKKSNKRIR